MGLWQLQRSTNSHSTHVALLVSLPGTGDSANQEQDGIYCLGEYMWHRPKEMQTGNKEPGELCCKF